MKMNTPTICHASQNPVGGPPKNFCVPKTDRNCLAPFINFIFCYRTILLMWVGKGGAGSARAGQAPNTHPPPPGHQAMAWCGCGCLSGKLRWF